MTRTYLLYHSNRSLWDIYHTQQTTNTFGSDTLPMRFAFLTVLGFPTENLIGLSFLILLQFLHVTLFISVCFIKVALEKKCGIIFKKQILFRLNINELFEKNRGQLKHKKKNIWGISFKGEFKRSHMNRIKYNPQIIKEIGDSDFLYTIYCLFWLNKDKFYWDHSHKKFTRRWL